MTIKQMVEYLQEQGFWVAKPEYIPQSRMYQFRIGKDGNISTERITIPDYILSTNQTYTDPLLLKSYCNLLIEKYEEKFGKKTVTVKGITHEWTDPETGKKYGYSWGFGNIGPTVDELETRLIDRGLNEFGITFDDYIKEGNLTMNKVDYTKKYKHGFVIKKVIFNPPATIVYWDDGTKTVVKAYNETFDPEKGLAMAISKKALGNEGNYFNHIKKWVDAYRPATDVLLDIKPYDPNEVAYGTIADVDHRTCIEHAYNRLDMVLKKEKANASDYYIAIKCALIDLKPIVNDTPGLNVAWTVNILNIWNNKSAIGKAANSPITNLIDAIKQAHKYLADELSKYDALHNVEKAYLIIKATLNDANDIVKKDLIDSCAEALKYLEGDTFKSVWDSETIAFDILNELLRTKKHTRAEILSVMEEALGYLGEALDE